jgi:hypothetical protein
MYTTLYLFHGVVSRQYSNDTKDEFEDINNKKNKNRQYMVLVW